MGLLALLLAAAADLPVAAELLAAAVRVVAVALDVPGHVLGALGLEAAVCYTVAMPSEEIFFEIGIVLVIAAALSLLVHRLKQPLILAYLIAGTLVAPGLLALVGESAVFDVMSQIGVAFLLFTVGLGLNWRVVKHVGGIALVTGVGQVLFTGIIGFLILQAMGFAPLTSIYLSVALAFSSTIVIVKMLLDKEEMDTLYGRISIGFLLVQDFIALLILLGLDTLRAGLPLDQLFLQTLLKGLLLVPALWLVSRFAVPPLVAYAARSQELLFVFSIAWAFLVAWLLTRLGFGIAFGSLVAGVMLSGTVYQNEINARIRPLRDFFLIIFFIVLGMQLSVAALPGMLWPIIILSLFVLIGNPFIVLLLMRLLGYHPRTGFLAGTTVAQISEFSFILIAAGISMGHLESSNMGLITVIGLVTFAASAYLISANEKIYEFLRPLMRWMEPKQDVHRERAAHERPQAVLFGVHRVGRQILEPLQRLKKPFAVVDVDPAVVRDLTRQGLPVVYGDAGDDLFLAELGVHKAKLVISTIPSAAISASLLSFLRHRGFRGTSIVSARTQDEAAQCYRQGATYVIVPHLLGGEKFRELFEKQHVRAGSWQRLGVQAKNALE